MLDPFGNTYPDDYLCVPLAVVLDIVDRGLLGENDTARARMFEELRQRATPMIGYGGVTEGEPLYIDLDA